MSYRHFSLNPWSVQGFRKMLAREKKDCGRKFESGFLEVETLVDRNKQSRCNLFGNSEARLSALQRLDRGRGGDENQGSGRFPRFQTFLPSDAKGGRPFAARKPSALSAIFQTAGIGMLAVNAVSRLSAKLHPLRQRLNQWN